MKFALVLAFFAVCAVSTIQGASVENNDAAPVVPEPAPVAEEKKQGGFQFFNPFAAVINTVKNVMGMGNNEQGGEMQENIKRVQEIISKIQVLADSDPEAAKVVNKLRANPLSFFENIDECMALLRQVVPKPENTSETAEGEEDIKPIEEVIEADNEDGKKKGFNPIQAALNLFKNIDERRKRLGRFWNEFRRDPLSIVHNFDAIKGDFVFVKGLLQNGLKAGKILNDFRCNPLSMMQNYDEAVELVTGEKPVKKEPETEVVADETAVAVPEKKKSEVETVADRGFRALSIVMEIRCNPLKLFDNIDKLAALADEVTPVGEDGQKQNNPLSFVLNLVKGLAQRKDQAFQLFDKIRKNPLSALEHIDDIVKVLTG